MKSIQQVHPLHFQQLFSKMTEKKQKYLFPVNQEGSSYPAKEKKEVMRGKKESFVCCKRTRDMR